MLLSHADDLARSFGLNELRLYTNAKFTANIAFYSHRGFEEFLRESHPAGGDVVHMNRPVKRQPKRKRATVLGPFLHLPFDVRGRAVGAVWHAPRRRASAVNAGKRYLLSFLSALLPFCEAEFIPVVVPDLLDFILLDFMFILVPVASGPTLPSLEAPGAGCVVCDEAIMVVPNSEATTRAEMASLDRMKISPASNR
jgi:hypothetical protein